MNIIRKSISFVFLLLACNAAFAQMPDNNNVLPEKMKFMSLDNVVLTNKDIPANKPLLMIYFDPTCGHCQFMGKQLAQRIGLYPNITIWMVSNYPDSSIKQYLFNDGLFPARKLTVLQDYSNNMHNWFDFADVPLMLLYSKDGKLLQNFDVLPTPPELEKILKQAHQL